MRIIGKICRIKDSLDDSSKNWRSCVFRRCLLGLVAAHGVIAAVLIFLIVTSRAAEASFFDRDRSFILRFGGEKKEKTRRVSYLESRDYPKLVDVAEDEPGSRSISGSNGPPPSYREFIARMEAMGVEEVKPREIHEVVEAVVEEKEEPVRRTVVRSEFDFVGESEPGEFPRPERDTVSFEDIYLFFPVQDGDAEKMGLVRGQLNRSIFTPPGLSGLKSGATFETVEK